MLRLSTDDLLLISTAAMGHGRPPAAEQVTDVKADLGTIARIIELIDVIGSEDPIDDAARLVAHLVWERPLGTASERTALLAVAVILDQNDVRVPFDWTGCAELIRSQRRSGLGLGARTEQIRDWLQSGLAAARGAS